MKKNVKPKNAKTYGKKCFRLKTYEKIMKTKNVEKSYEKNVNFKSMKNL